MPFGVFVDLGGVDGLIHITDLSWSRINSPEEVVSLDEKINVVILDFDEDKPDNVKEYRLTEENLPFIDPMIGITQEDIEQFFKK